MLPPPPPLPKFPKVESFVPVVAFKKAGGLFYFSFKFFFLFFWVVFFSFWWQVASLVVRGWLLLPSRFLLLPPQPLLLRNLTRRQRTIPLPPELGVALCGHRLATHTTSVHLACLYLLPLLSLLLVPPHCCSGLRGS